MTLATVEPQVEVYVDGTYRGVTPLDIKLPPGCEHTIEFRREGFRAKTVVLTHTLGGGWVVLDVLAGLVPVIVDAATGAWYRLDAPDGPVALEPAHS